MKNNRIFIKNLLLLASLVLIYSCGKKETQVNITETIGCTINTQGNLTSILCPDGTSSTFINNNDSVDSESIISYIVNPCGDSGNDDEILMVTKDNQYLRYKGKKEYLQVLKDGKYKTNDKQKCEFEIQNGDIIESFYE